MATELPPAPPIPGEAMLEIFVHRSLRNTGNALNPDSAYGNGERLVALGSKVLEAVYAHVLFRKKPPMSAAALSIEQEKLPEHVARWVGEYQWMEKIRHSQDVDLYTPEETRYIMDAYVGAVFVAGGYLTLYNWIESMVQALPADPEPVLHDED
ncbi:hypothetical protein DICSQDRAFT_171904 [Dichomitus squalens LYAD-421 SS1]|uniref:RNase III domain-containing protein n=2 Tax=Dichomitus squalens TaxID=114155 RepID=A0A4Q9PZV7_9APHY|nr:uncharacterized protein DICSQDRAFT_171904 [Dichomitus squalens LYAD-421 SS1]EJF59502.1 hypothetical protein DICSQDRAFT_171904 [Dichomitus squalens LYAD-421 SS1]TBU22385.1 hypothetical protein BD311DRAFT_676250 [Dichomitus squalens]TBU60387.1 hypothetical protein BD310DRAFT_922865 [Dichomitus squalens]